MSDPKRLADESKSVALVAMLSAAEADVLDLAAVERVRLGVARGLANGGGGSGSGGSTAGWLLRLGLPAVVVAVVAVVAFRPAPSVEERPATALPPSVAAEQNAAAPSSEPTPFSGSEDVPSPPPPEPMRAPHRRATPGPSATPPSAPREGTLLLEARRALATNPTRALELVEAHAREFPKSQLTPEREQIRAEAAKRIAP
jgi:hypothetical protein